MTEHNWTLEEAAATIAILRSRVDLAREQEAASSIEMDRLSAQSADRYESMRVLSMLLADAVARRDRAAGRVRGRDGCPLHGTARYRAEYSEEDLHHIVRASWRVAWESTMDADDAAR